MRLAFFPIAILLGFCFFAVQASTASPNTTAKLKTNAYLVDSPIMRLGDGYFTYNHIAAGESALNLDDTKIVYSNMQSTIFLTQTIDHNELAKILNVDISANGGWGLFSASASAAYLNHTEDNQFTENFSFMERYYIKSLLDISNLPANISALSDNAAELYTEGGIEQFTNRYGDTFITELPIGAVLVANVQLNFSTALDKQKFDANIKGQLGSIFSAALSIEKVIEKTKVKGYMEISAYQVGGNPEELPKIFSKKCKHGYYLTTCSLENLKDCRTVIDDIISYAQVDFKKQINPIDSLGKKPKGNLVVVGEPLLTTYTSKFNLMPSPKLDSGVLAHRLKLASLYKHIKNDKTFIDHFISSPVSAYFSSDAYKLIKNIQDNLDWNISLVKQFGPLCYVSGNENQCVNTLETIRTNSKSIDPQALDFYMNHAFIQMAPNCNYIPVGTPKDENPIYASYCFDQWIKGLFVFKFNDDKSILQVNGDYILPNGLHIQSAAILHPYYTGEIYTGLATFRNLKNGFHHNRQISIQLSRNNI